MITYVKGDIFESGCEALVNPVNTEGVMGKGLALEFKKRFPENYFLYKLECEAGFMDIGSILPYYENGTWVLNFPTKDYWRDPSEVYMIEDGLVALREWISFGEKIHPGPKSIAIPALGCGLGGLSWAQVKQMIERHLSGFKALDIKVYEPQ